ACDGRYRDTDRKPQSTRADTRLHIAAESLMRRDGFALLLVLLAVIALELLTLSSLALATHEHAVATAQKRTVRARRQAEAALRRVVSSPSRYALDALLVGQHRVFADTGGITITAHRHGWGLFEISAAAPAGRAVLRRSIVLRQLDAQRAFSEMYDALVSAGPLTAATATFTTKDTLDCAIPLVPLRAARSVTVARAADAIDWHDATIDSTHAISPAGYALGGLAWSELEGIADTVVSGETYLVDRDTAGVPLTRLVYAPSDLIVSGGQGHGLLLVNGDLDFRAGQFAGVVIVRGTLAVGDGVRVDGGVRVQGNDLSRIGAASLNHSRCHTAHALLAAPAAGRLVRGARRFIPTF
ncbi:MAG TPA: hypothetical protein VFO52_13870, partial [Longimicrobiales bacterium]|nr:hypothetical protein [Longimicrobiales bacterium]